MMIVKLRGIVGYISVSFLVVVVLSFLLSLISVCRGAQVRETGRRGAQQSKL
jgi:hypothetical protein